MMCVRQLSSPDKTLLAWRPGRNDTPDIGLRWESQFHLDLLKATTRKTDTLVRDMKLTFKETY